MSCILFLSFTFVYVEVRSSRSINEYLNVKNWWDSFSKIFITGIIYLYVEDELRVEGRLHSNGETGGDSKAGGGAGGSLYISVNHLDGTGTIEVTGGAGNNFLIMCFGLLLMMIVKILKF